jgi:hypothetical protein
VSAPVRASLGQLRALVDGDWLIDRLGWTPEKFAGGGLERSPGVLAGQGGWWYRGEFSAEEVGGRVRLVHRVFNVAPQGWWAPALANRLFIGYRAGIQRRVDELARAADSAVLS